MRGSFSSSDEERAERFLAAIERVHRCMVKRVKTSPPRALSTLWRWYADELAIHRYQTRTRIIPPAYNRDGW
jgi:hypothetical protein